MESIKDGNLKSRYQIENSMFYEMTLEQRWELIFERGNNDHDNVIMVEAVVQIEVVLVEGRDAAWDEKNVVDNTILFTTYGSRGEEV
ncbi:hypothetical protein ACET3Z_024813 [Daucus carota]